MSLPFQSSDSVKQAIFEELQHILNPDKHIRVSAEGRMKKLEFTEGKYSCGKTVNIPFQINFLHLDHSVHMIQNRYYHQMHEIINLRNFIAGYGVHLAEIIMNQSYDLALRQLAGVLLNKYVEEHWSNEGYEEESLVIASVQAKQMIRKILPNGLYDPNSKIRVTVALTISTIATSDWPNTWTELFDIIVKCLGGNEDSIHGAMQVLVEFTYDLDSQISVVGPIILSEIYRIFEAEQVYSVKTRSCAVTIFKSLLLAINQHIEEREEKSKMLDPVLPAFMTKMIEALNKPCGPTSSFELKTEVIKGEKNQSFHSFCL